MIALIEVLLALPALLLLLMAGFFAFEVAGSFLPPRRAPGSGGKAGPVAVVMPAHNEALGIEPAIRDVKAQLRPGDRLIVVADNCDDDTAEIAMRAGASCLIRNEPERRGKGYALQFALDRLRDDPPEIVLFVDADCRLAPGALARTAAAAAASDRPAQALYLMQAGEGAPAETAVSEFAWLLINRVRMGGLSTLFDVTRLTGAGMALPWRVASALDLASGEIVEDLALTADLVAAGEAPVFCPEALVTSAFPSTDEGKTTQRARWENGSLRLAFARGPGLLAEAFRRGDIRLAALAFDLLVPPLTVLAAALAAMFLLALPAFFLGADLPLRLVYFAIALFAGASFGAWVAYGRAALPASAFGGVGDYIFRKMSVYGEAGRRSASRWTRAERDGEGGGA